MAGPYRAEFGAILHEDQQGFLFTVSPQSTAPVVAEALNTAASMQALVDAAREFCRRVEAGEVRSKRSYAAFKDALADMGKA